MSRRSELALPALAALLALVAWLGLHQLPASHAVDIGAADAAYVQGFGEREQADAPLAARRPYLAGAANARPLGPAAALLWPQAGAPGSLTLRWRSATAPLSVSLLLNGQQPLGQSTVLSATWSNATFRLTQPQTKWSGDWFVSFAASEPAALYLDSAVYAVEAGSGFPPRIPLLGLVISAGLLAGLLPRRWRMWRALGGAGLALTAFALLYRWPPSGIAYPIRLLPLLLPALGCAAYAVREAPRLASRPRLAEGLLGGGALLLWFAWLWRAQMQHLVLALPGVEADFSVFAKRSANWAAVWRADGFYQLGYPLLLRLVRPLVADSPFLSARLISVGAALVVAAATWALARARWGRLVGLLALLMTLLSPLLTQYAMQLGTDMPFAAACALALWALLRKPGLDRRWALLAGVAAGGAFSVRHPGLLLVGLAGWLIWRQSVAANLRSRARLAAPLLGLALLGFGLGAGPQIAVNLRDTGQPLYSQQAKNIWLAVYGNTEFRRWDEERNDIGLLELVRRDPPRFAANWWANLVAFSGSGGERAAEFERAVQLRMLAWPLNLLALAGLALWGWRWRREPAGGALLVWIALYVLGVTVGFLLPRFLLPLSPLYAIAAATLLAELLRREAALAYGRRIALAALMIIGVALPQAAAGVGNVLAGQIEDERMIAAAIKEQVPLGAVIAAHVDPRTALPEYSAVAQRLVSVEQPGPAERWLVWEGDPPPGWQAVARSGPLGLYRR